MLEATNDLNIIFCGKVASYYFPTLERSGKDFPGPSLHNSMRAGAVINSCFVILCIIIEIKQIKGVTTSKRNIALA